MVVVVLLLGEAVDWRINLSLLETKKRSKEQFSEQIFVPEYLAMFFCSLLFINS